ncbi:MAG: hypothetical protein RLZZ232_3363 [Planctomycetota bacterium]
MVSSHCGRFRRLSGSRRDLLSSAACGFGAIAASHLLASTLPADESASPLPTGDPQSSGVKPTHFPPKALSVIFLYMDGGVSQVDSFDPKPALERMHGKPFPSRIEPTQFNNIGNTLASPWKFKNYGQSGIPVSDLFPEMARHVDDMAIIRSMTSAFPEHTNANYFLHTGSGLQGRPSMGAWFGYGLGSECVDLPHFVILNGGLIPPGGLDNFGSGFLPASYQGSVFGLGDPPVADIRPRETTATSQRRKLDLIRSLDLNTSERYGHDDQVESAIRNYELAARMQLAVPDLMNLSDETKETQDLYGISDEFPNTQIFARECLLARRLVERGVRFIELTCPAGNGDRWDQHSNLVDGHTKNARSVDKPIAALLTDLKQRGLMNRTLVVWSGEFGRTPFAQGSDGRDHNPFGFSMWMAGAGIKGGTIYGETDEFGYKAVVNKAEIHDMHATMLHLMGMDHERLTYRFGGRDMRLTDVHGMVLKDILS